MNIRIFQEVYHMNSRVTPYKRLSWHILHVSEVESSSSPELMKLQDIIRAPPNKNVEIYIRQGVPNTYREVLKEVKHKEIYSVIVDTRPENMHLFLRCVSNSVYLRFFVNFLLNPYWYFAVHIQSNICLIQIKTFFSCFNDIHRSRHICVIDY